MENLQELKSNLILNCNEILGLKDIVGSITLKRLTLKEKITAAALSSDYKMGRSLSIRFENIAYCLATLETAIIQKPKEIDLDELEEETLFDIFEKYEQWLDTFRENIRKEQKENSSK